MKKIITLLALSIMFIACGDISMTTEPEYDYTPYKVYSSSSVRQTIYSSSSTKITIQSSSSVNTIQRPSSSSVSVKEQQACNMGAYDLGFSEQYLRSLCAKYKAQGYYAFQNCSCSAITKAN